MNWERIERICQISPVADKAYLVEGDVRVDEISLNKYHCWMRVLLTKCLTNLFSLDILLVPLP